jgi:glycosyltransferase involved in cell wall biosynthesis
MRNESVSIVIPAFNEEQGIQDVILGLHKRYPDYEILVVDDGSTDKTAEIAGQLPCRLIQHKINKGYGASWKTGIDNAENDIIVFFDGDNQFDPDDIKRLLATFYDEEADMVSGSRSKKSHVPLRRRPLKIILKWFVEFLVERPIEDLNCGLRCVRRSMIEKYISLLPNGFSASTTSLVIFLYQNCVVKFIPIKTEKRVGTSSVKILRDGMGTVMLIVRLVAMFNPLKIFLPTSALFLFFSIAYSTYEAYVHKMGIPVLGAMLFITAILIFFFGIICDQISALRLSSIRNKDA